MQEGEGKHARKCMQEGKNNMQTKPEIKCVKWVISRSAQKGKCKAVKAKGGRKMQVRNRENGEARKQARDKLNA